MNNADGVRVTGPMHDRYDEVLTPEALGLIGALHRDFDAHRRELVAKRAVRVAADSQPAGDFTTCDSLGVESSDIFLHGHGYRHLLSSSFRRDRLAVATP